MKSKNDCKARVDLHNKIFILSYIIQQIRISVYLVKPKKNSNIEGPEMNDKKNCANLRKYAKNRPIKGISFLKLFFS